MVEDGHRLAAHGHAAELKRPLAPANAALIRATPSRICFSFAAYARDVIHHLRKCHVEVTEGLSDEEFARVEVEFGFIFPPDLKGILQEGLPIGDGFPNWRSGESALLRLKLGAPISGLCYEVGKGRFWWESWGIKPPDPQQAMAVARHALRKAPILVPVCKHCYIPSAPSLAGNPVFFVYGKQIGYCGFDFADFFQREHFLLRDYSTNSDSSRIFITDKIDGELTRSVFVNLKEEDKARGRRGNGVEALNLASLRILLEGSGWKCEGFTVNVEARGENICTATKENGKVQSKESLQTFENVIHEPILSNRGYESGSRSAHVSLSNSMSRLDVPRKSIDLTTTQTSPPPFTIRAPVWAAKQPRHIEFWSDVVEKARQSDFISKESLYYAPKAGDATFNEAKVVEREENVQVRGGLGSDWITKYLDIMAGQLRNGGWKENEISEMVNVHFNPDSSCEYVTFDRQSVLEDLTSKVKMLSISLKRAGWTSQEVAEAFGASPEKENAKTPHEFAAKLEKLAVAAGAENLARA